MKMEFNLRGHICAAITWALLCAAGLMPLRAQTGGASITGTILDQAGKPIEAAAVTVKSESGSMSGSGTSGAEGKFSVTGLAAGTYTVETTSPGFARNTRLGVILTANGTQELTITMNVDSVS